MGRGDLFLLLILWVQSLSLINGTLLYDLQLQPIYNAHSDWLIPGHYSPVMPASGVQACKHQAKSHVIYNLLTSNARSSRENLKPRYRSVNTERSWSEIFPSKLNVPRLISGY